MKQDDNKAVHWHVLGAGAMGCLWSARLWQWAQVSGRVEVTLLLRDQKALADYPGLILESAGQTQFCPVAATHVGDLERPLSHLLLATKAGDASQALAGIAAQLSPDARIVLLQNGLKSQQQIAGDYPQQEIWCLSSSHGAWTRAPYEVVHAGMGQAWLGAYANGRDDCAGLLEHLPASQMNISCDADIRSRLWLKFAINCAINALTVIHDCPNGDLLHPGEARQQLKLLCAEIESIFAVIPEAPRLSDLQARVDQVLHATASNYSSTLQDARRGRATELDALNAHLCEIARARACACSENAAVLQGARRRLLEMAASRPCPG